MQLTAFTFWEKSEPKQVKEENGMAKDRQTSEGHRDGPDSGSRRSNGPEGGAADGRGNGKTALVTGGSRGIGRGIAIALAMAGYKLAITHWQDDVHAAETAERIRAASGQECLVLPGNLAEPGVAERTAEQAIAGLGTIDVLVNNAGVTLKDPVERLPTWKLDHLIQLNFRSPLILMRELSAHMIDAGIRGNILNITSSRAERAYPGDAVYGGLKAGLKRASESAALDLAPYGIRVNCLAPGATLVREGMEPHEGVGRQVPLGRMGTPEDMGRIAAWLVSDAASYVTGITLRADGGLILPGMPEDGVSVWGSLAKTEMKGREV
ncbi:short-chain dehydrogenase [Paenibacillus cisolokensis]|uniref:Short-chain dehydrogenase n=1 Tax=Paenibacillus cisolokensis TaxID=1658519 RepID=A0ABQ4N6F9_9BACL|nr:SDR family oxidoreductase [Paenibacillus cisolokensis]GIQ63749.1 short-chain dehydrogenase [Paenibacillus cisolokensis]